MRQHRKKILSRRGRQKEGRREGKLGKREKEMERRKEKEGKRRKERERRKEGEREKEREIHLEIVSASVWPLAYWN